MISLFSRSQAAIIPAAPINVRIGFLAGAVNFSPQQRYAASMKAVKQRMRTVANIQKITKAMKMVSAAKLRHDQRRLDMGMPFGRPVLALLDRLPVPEETGKLTLIGVTSDKGLCGGVNSSVSKETRNTLLHEEENGREVGVFMIGNKGVAALKRLFANRFTVSVDEVTKSPWNYSVACAVVQRLLDEDPQRLKIVYNKFASLISFDTVNQPVHTKESVKTIDRLEWSRAVDQYTFEPSVFEVWEDLHEFYYSCVVFTAGLQGFCAEQASRMQAMTNASKNAGEMLEQLELLYNRARQAKITTELCEIISGAAAV